MDITSLPEHELTKVEARTLVKQVPRPASTFAAFASNGFEDVYNNLPTDSAVMHSAPDVSERLRDQRVHVLLAKFDTAERRRTTASVPGRGIVAGREVRWLRSPRRKVCSNKRQRRALFAGASAARTQAAPGQVRDSNMGVRRHRQYPGWSGDAGSTLAELGFEVAPFLF